MAKNTGHNYRKGAVRWRTQTLNSRTRVWMKRGPGGCFMDGKANGKPFKGIRRER